MPSNKNHYKERVQRRKEEKAEEPELPKYRDRAKERREDQNPDYEPTDLAFHAVAPPGAVEIRSEDAQKLSIEKSKYLGGDVEHTHLVKGLDYALLHKVRSEMDKKPDNGEDDEDDGKSRAVKDDRPLSFRTALAKSMYQWMVKPPTVIKTNEMFLPGRMAFVFNVEGGYSNDIPTTLHRSKADCLVPEEVVTVSVDGSVLDRIAKIMSYLRLGSSGKVLKKKKKEREVKGKVSGMTNYDEGEKVLKHDGILPNNFERENPLPPPPPPPKTRQTDFSEKQKPVVVAHTEEDDIFVGVGVNYEVAGKDMSQSPIYEDMEESPTNKEKTYFNEPAYGPVPPSDPSQGWHENGYDAMQAQVLATGYQGEWQDYQYADQSLYADQYLQQNMQAYGVQENPDILQDPHFMTQEEKDRGLGSVFKRDDQRLQQLREKDAREKDPNFISESYSECYPGYQEYNREVVDSDEDDLSKMDMGGRAKGRLHRWDFETEEDWAKYNEQKEAMPKAAFQFGVKMQDGRKTRKQNKDQKLTNELHKINKIIAKKKMDRGEGASDGGAQFEDAQPGKKLRL